MHGITIMLRWCQRQKKGVKRRQKSFFHKSSNVIYFIFTSPSLDIVKLTVTCCHAIAQTLQKLSFLKPTTISYASDEHGEKYACILCWTLRKNENNFLSFSRAKNCFLIVFHWKKDFHDIIITEAKTNTIWNYSAASNSRCFVNQTRGKNVNVKREFELVFHQSFFSKIKCPSGGK